MQFVTESEHQELEGLRTNYMATLIVSSDLGYLEWQRKTKGQQHMMEVTTETTSVDKGLHALAEAAETDARKAQTKPRSSWFNMSKLLSVSSLKITPELFVYL